MTDMLITTTTTAKPIYWRDVLPIHPAANDIPEASDSERRALAGDLARHGLKVPVVLVRVAGGLPQLLDGRHRLDLLESTGIKVVGDDGGVLVRHQIIDVADDAEAKRLSLSLNAHRRMLSAHKRRELLLAQIRATPEKSDREIGRIVGFSDKTVAKDRRSLEATAEIPQLEKTVGADGKVRTKPIKEKLRTEEADRDLLRMIGLDPSDLSAADIAKGSELARRISQCDRVPGARKRRPQAIADWQAFVRRIAERPEAEHAVLLVKELAQAPLQADAIRSAVAAADLVTRVFGFLDLLITAADEHPDWIDAERIGERLQTKGAAFIELALHRRAP